MLDFCCCGGGGGSMNGYVNENISHCKQKPKWAIGFAARCRFCAAGGGIGADVYVSIGPLFVCVCMRVPVCRFT